MPNRIDDESTQYLTCTLAGFENEVAVFLIGYERKIWQILAY